MIESQWKEEYDNFVSAHEEKIEEDFSSKNDFQTSVRGVKIRGVS